jgi:hypothetical protein
MEEKTAYALQQKTNEWLEAHKDISVAYSNIAPSAAGFCVYIMYTTTEAQIDELRAITTAIEPEASIEPTDINPDVLKATS